MEELIGTGPRGCLRLINSGFLGSIRRSGATMTPAIRAPRLGQGFWGEGGIERVHTGAGGWPHLVQLIAETIVDILNDEAGKQVTSSLLERALDQAIVSGQNVLRELLYRESGLPGEWENLSKFDTIVNPCFFAHSQTTKSSASLRPTALKCVESGNKSATREIILSERFSSNSSFTPAPRRACARGRPQRRSKH
jgi:hypothetical protein